MAALPAPGWLQPCEFHVQVLVSREPCLYLLKHLMLMCKAAAEQGFHRMALDNQLLPSGTGGVVESLK